MKQHGGRKKGIPQKGSSFPIVNNDAAGIDIGSEEHWVAVPEDRDENPVRPFGCFTADLHAVARWLKACGVTTVAMESTGVYWIPLSRSSKERCLRLPVAAASPHLWPPLRFLTPRRSVATLLVRPIAIMINWSRL